MILVRHPLKYSAGGSTVAVPVDRRTLARRRFRATAADGTDFGFDVEEPLRHGEAFFQEEGRTYVIDQQDEEVLRIPYGTAEEAALLGWRIGNLHFPAQVESGALLAEDDTALVQMLQREGIAFERVRRIFAPPRHEAHAHGHHTHHEQESHPHGS